jgi:hypothetical protein
MVPFGPDRAKVSAAAVDRSRRVGLGDQLALNPRAGARDASRMCEAHNNTFRQRAAIVP